MTCSPPLFHHHTIGRSRWGSDNDEKEGFVIEKLILEETQDFFLFVCVRPLKNQQGESVPEENHGEQ